MYRTTLLCLALIVAACNEGHDEFLNRDLAVVADLSGSDMPDGGADAAAGPTCGEMFTCLLMSGLGGGGGGGGGGLGGLGMCFQGAQPEAIQQATALGLCAATNCLGGIFGGGGDGGGINPIQIGICLLGQCSTEVENCEGLNLGGLGGGGGPN
jgi:hypothetical protein